MVKKGNDLLDKNDIEGAVQSYEAALELARKNNRKHQSGICLICLGNVSETVRDYGKAMTHYFGASEYFRENGEKDWVSTVLLCISRVHGKQKNYQEATAAPEKALKLKDESGDKAGRALVLAYIGNNLKVQGNYEKAIRCLKEAAAIKEELRDFESLANIYNTIGFIYYSRTEDTNSALANYDKALIRVLLRLHDKKESPAGRDASESNASKLLGDYGTIHFATHGYLDDEKPILYSSIVLSEPEDVQSDGGDDGYLRAAEIFNIPIDAGLVVLSG